MKRIITCSSLVLTTVIGLAIPTQAHVLTGNKQFPTTETTCVATTPEEQIALNAAKNEARQLAEVTNGGLSVYRAEPTMHGAVIKSPCEMLGPDTWRFTFRGGEPTAVITLEEYTILSVVTVTGTGSERKVTLEYNGPIEEYGKQVGSQVGYL